MTHYANYDAWKLSNPDDDGHYTEDTKARIEEPIYFKYQMKWNRRHLYGMITTSGYDIKIWNIGRIRTIDIDEIETYVEDVYSEIDRIKSNYENFEYISMQEFYAEFEQVHSKTLKIVQDATNN
jgi:hypothetical protein